MQILQRMKRLNMTKQEIRDEMKDQDGNPQVKGAIRQRMIQNLNASMRKGVEEASVVLTNPTHFAVAPALSSRARWRAHRRGARRRRGRRRDPRAGP